MKDLDVTNFHFEVIGCEPNKELLNGKRSITIDVDLTEEEYESLKALEVPKPNNSLACPHGQSKN